MTHRTTINLPDILHIKKLTMLITLVTLVFYFIKQAFNIFSYNTLRALMYKVQHQTLSYKCTPLYLIITVFKYANSLGTLPQHIYIKS